MEKKSEGIKKSQEVLRFLALLGQNREIMRHVRSAVGILIESVKSTYFSNNLSIKLWFKRFPTL